MDYIPFLLIGILITMLIVGFLAKNGKEEPAAVLWVVIGFVGMLAVLRGYQFFYFWTPILLYAIGATATYVVAFPVALFWYKDPVDDYKGDLREFAEEPLFVHYSVPVFNEPKYSKYCLESISAAAEFASEFIDTDIVAVNDASNDGETPQRLDETAANLSNVSIIHLLKNGRKKNALVAAMCGGENWREGYYLFEKIHGRKPRRGDHEEIIRCLEEVGCKPRKLDKYGNLQAPKYYFHTDSDSIVGVDFILKVIKAFMSDDQIGAISGHCDVLLPKDGKPTLITKMQIAWYKSQFRIRKAAESAFGSVFCVSGPGAAFRAEAILPWLLEWVDDAFGGRIYTGATDRMITYLVLKDGWKIKYAESAKVQTVVPSNLQELMKQWTRWKQNAWRMFIPVWQYAWKTHPVVAFLTYARLIEMVFAPFLFSYHFILLLLGDYESAALYLAGIGMMGSLMGLSSLIFIPSELESALLRPVLSILSSSLGSVLNVESLRLTLQGSLVWREVTKGKARWGYYKWLGFDPSFIWHYLEVIAIIVGTIYLIKYFW